jgi:hypothetical protein
VKPAVQLLTAAVARAPTNPTIRLHLAKGLIASNDKVAARKEIGALLDMKLDPQQRTEAQELLSGL